MIFPKKGSVSSYGKLFWRKRAVHTWRHTDRRTGRSFINVFTKWRLQETNWWHCIRPRVSVPYTNPWCPCTVGKREGRKRKATDFDMEIKHFRWQTTLDLFPSLHWTISFNSFIYTELSVSNRISQSTDYKKMFAWLSAFVFSKNNPPPPPIRPPAWDCVTELQNWKSSGAGRIKQTT
jgi:hypothetical protein